ncbi:MAG: hypothetical protein V4479_07860 [Actinomycetota bacterium]
MVLTMGFLTVPGQASVAAKSAIGSLVTANTPSDLSVLAAAAGFPHGSSTAVIVPPAPAILVAQGAALASRLAEPLLVSSSVNSTTDLSRQLKQLKVKSATILGATKSFTSAFLKSLSKSLTLNKEIFDDDDFVRSTAIAKFAGFDRLVAWLCAGEVGAVRDEWLRSRTHQQDAITDCAGEEVLRRE